MHRVGSTGNTANSTRPRKERRITYVLRDSNDSKVLTSDEVNCRFPHFCVGEFGCGF